MAASNRVISEREYLSSLTEQQASIASQKSQEVSQPTSVVVQNLSESMAISTNAAKDTLEKFKQNPNTEEFKTLSQDDRLRLEVAKAAEENLKGFEVQPDWKPSQETLGKAAGAASGQPLYYTDKDGTKHYNPKSTMYEMGYDTSKEYVANEAPKVTVLVAGVPVRLKQEVAEKLGMLPDEEQKPLLYNLLGRSQDRETQEQMAVIPYRTFNKETKRYEYNVTKAIEDSQKGKVNEKLLERVFGTATIQEQKPRVAALSNLKEKEIIDKEGKVNINKALEEKIPWSELKELNLKNDEGKEFTEADYNALEKSVTLSPIQEMTQGDITRQNELITKIQSSKYYTQPDDFVPEGNYDWAGLLASGTISKQELTGLIGEKSTNQISVYNKVRPFMIGETFTAASLSNAIENIMKTEGKDKETVVKELRESGLFDTREVGKEVSGDMFGKGSTWETRGQWAKDTIKEISGAVTSLLPYSEKLQQKIEERSITPTYNKEEYKPKTPLLDIAAKYVGQPVPQNEFVADYVNTHKVPDIITKYGIKNVVIGTEGTIASMPITSQREYIEAEQTINEAAKTEYEAKYGEGSWLKASARRVPTAVPQVLSAGMVEFPAVTSILEPTRSPSGKEWMVTGVNTALFIAPPVLKGAGTYLKVPQYRVGYPGYKYLSEWKPVGQFYPSWMKGALGITPETGQSKWLNKMREQGRVANTPEALYEQKQWALAESTRQGEIERQAQEAGKQVLLREKLGSTLMTGESGYGGKIKGVEYRTGIKTGTAEEFSPKLTQSKKYGEDIVREGGIDIPKKIESTEPEDIFKLQKQVKDVYRIEKRIPIREVKIVEKVEPAVQKGYTRLYRGEDLTDVGFPSIREELRGQWFTTDRKYAELFAFVKEKGVLKYTDVPTSELPKYHEKLPKPEFGKEKAFRNVEYIVPREKITGTWQGKIPGYIPGETDPRFKISARGEFPGYSSKGEGGFFSYEPERIGRFSAEGGTRVPTKPRTVETNTGTKVGAGEVVQQSVVSNASVSFYKTPSGLLVPKVSPYIISAPIIPSLIPEKVEAEWSEPKVAFPYESNPIPEINLNSDDVFKTEPAIVSVPTKAPASVSISKPEVIASPAVETENINITGTEVRTIQEPEITTVSIPKVEISLPTPKIDYTPPTEQDYVPPVAKIPKPPIPVVGGASLGGSGGGFSKHGLHSSYVYTPFEIPEMYVALPEVKWLKPDKLSLKMFKKFLRQPEGIELLGEEEDFESTPFGRKSVRTVVAKARMKSGAKETGVSYQPSIRKNIVNGKTSYEPITSPRALGDMGL